MKSNLKPILLVEDSENDAELILAAMAENNLGNHVITVRDGEEALDYLYRRGSRAGAERPIVVLMDIKMPKLNGIEVLRAMKADPAFKTIPVVMMTSSRQGPDVIECYRLGANAYVVKPVEFKEFFDAVKAVGQFWGVVNESPIEETND